MPSSQVGELVRKLSGSDSKTLAQLSTGSYFETIVTNTTSIYVVLNNVHSNQVSSVPASPLEGKGRRRHRNQHQLAKNRRLPQQVSIIAEVEGVLIQGIQEASSIVAIAENLDTRRAYKLKITHMGCHRNVGYSAHSQGEVLEFEGLWVDRPVPEQVNGITDATTIDTFKQPRPVADILNYFDHHTSSTGQRKRPVIELVTSERPFLHARLRDEHQNAKASLHERTNAWYNLLGSKLSANVALVSTERSKLVDPDDTKDTIHDLFFRFGPGQNTHLSSRPWSFATYQPSVLILQFGLPDFIDFLSTWESTFPNQPFNPAALETFMTTFETAYVKFIKTIRANAYPFYTSATSLGSSFTAAPDDDGSYIYNSAPSTLPIFLLAPFSAHNRFITKRHTFHEVISESLHSIALTLHSGGDKSTHWIDSSGWIDPRTDFALSPRRDGENRSPDPDILTPAATHKVASLLADHFCPYIKPALEGYTPFGESQKENCAFNKYDDYLGNVYVPQDVEFHRTVLERKIENIWQRLGFGNDAAERG